MKFAGPISTLNLEMKLAKDSSIYRTYQARPREKHNTKSQSQFLDEVFRVSGSLFYLPGFCCFKFSVLYVHQNLLGKVRQEMAIQMPHNATKKESKNTLKSTWNAANDFKELAFLVVLQPGLQKSQKSLNFIIYVINLVNKQHFELATILKKIADNFGGWFYGLSSPECFYSQYWSGGSCGGIFFLYVNVFPRKSLHFMLDPVQYREYEYGLWVKIY